MRAFQALNTNSVAERDPVTGLQPTLFPDLAIRPSLTRIVGRPGATSIVSGSSHRLRPTQSLRATSTHQPLNIEDVENSASARNRKDANSDSSAGDDVLGLSTNLAKASKALTPSRCVTGRS